jgi:hypothetical protein
VRGQIEYLRSRGRQPRGQTGTYWTRLGPVDIAPSSSAERNNLEAGNRIYNPEYQYGNPQEFQDDVMANSGGRTPLPAYGPEGPPGGPERLGYQMQGPLGQTLPGQGRLAWDGIPQSIGPQANGNPIGGQGRLQWPGIPQSVPVPQRADFQSAQADALRARNS